VSEREFNAAIPFCNATVANVAEPSWNVIVPVGVPDAEVTVAVSVIGLPSMDGSAEEASTVVVTSSGAGSTETVTVGDVLAPKFASPA
jgi:hypothetical protein